MSAILPVLLLAGIIHSSQNNSQDNTALKDENTEYSTLCSNFIINFSDLEIEKLKKGFLTGSLISCLDFQNNKLKNIDYNAFQNLSNLRYLEISSNLIDINDVFLNNFPSLEVLILDNNFTPELIVKDTYPKLRRLFLRNNFIESFDILKSNNAFPSLTHLYFSENFLIQTNSINLLTTLEYLDLTNNNFESFSLSNLNNLKNLIIDRSFERSLNGIYLTNLTNLQYLSASSNTLNIIFSFNFINLTSLLYLDLSDNEINYIEENTFDSMSKLQFLNLSNNAIEIIESGLFDKLENLQTLVLEKNSISVIPTMSNETKLETLMLNCNVIKGIVGGTFVKMPNLQTILLHDNEISYINQGAFEGLAKLKILTLSNNKLSTLPYNWMLPLTYLEELDLTGNFFEELSNLALSESSRLKHVYLSTQILYINTESLCNLPKNATIILNESIKFVEMCEKNRNKYY